jgi:hypothetical protein
MRKRALQTRRIDEHQATKPTQFRQLHRNHVDLLGILRIFFLGDVAADLIEENLGIAAIPVMYSCLFAGAVAQFGDHSSNRHDTDWKDAASDEMVQETTLAALNRPNTATVISSCPTDARVLARRPESAEISYRDATSAAKSRIGCKRDWASDCGDIRLEPGECALPFVSDSMSCVFRIIAPYL